MSLFDVFGVAGSALSAQKVRLNTIASNLANAETAASSPERTYKSKSAVFQAVLDQELGSQGVTAVKVLGIAEDNSAPRRQYSPQDPLADDDGYVYLPNINAVEEMSNMMAASRSFQINVELMNTSKDLLMRTLSLGK